MTCFWDGIMSKLPQNDVAKYLGDVTSKITFIELLKKRSRVVNINDVFWNDTLISVQEISEYKTWIDEYDTTKITQGHDTSVCDPFLVLICHIFICDIDHEYRGVVVRYRNASSNGKKKIYFASDAGHFW